MNHAFTLNGRLGGRLSGSAGLKTSYGFPTDISLSGSASAIRSFYCSPYAPEYDLQGDLSVSPYIKAEPKVKVSCFLNYLTFTNPLCAFLENKMSGELSSTLTPSCPLKYTFQYESIARLRGSAKVKGGVKGSIAGIGFNYTKTKNLGQYLYWDNRLYINNWERCEQPTVIPYVYF